jgi:6-pyruvoyltetrahydropterin/6-carboxytetrahydropterin synthase
MIIRKQFKFEGAHIVRNCTTRRCKKSIHGHSYVVEVFFTSNKLYDFGFCFNKKTY